LFWVVGWVVAISENETIFLMDLKDLPYIEDINISNL
jgi:hypothetical protein